MFSTMAKRSFLLLLDVSVCLGFMRPQEWDCGEMKLILSCNQDISATAETQNSLSTPRCQGTDSRNTVDSTQCFFGCYTC
jgi:hypothetical protein